jgi:YetA-like protein
VHYLGKFAPLGSRHNVMHWGCSAKQLRISTALNRRYYYFLTADERVGDLMREQLEAARTLKTIEPGRKLPENRGREQPQPDGDRAWLGFGTDWGSIAGAWLTEWERTGDRKVRARLLASMRTIGAQPRGFYTSGGWMNLDTGAFEIARHDRVGVSHLSAAFGLPEVCAELIELLTVPEFERSWIQYCELYNAPSELQQPRSNVLRSPQTDYRTDTVGLTRSFRLLRAALGYVRAGPSVGGAVKRGARQ